MSYNIEEITKEKFSKFGDFINPEEVQSTNINLNTTKSYFDLANIEIDGEEFPSGYNYIRYSAPEALPNLYQSDEDTIYPPILGSSYDLSVCIMPHQNAVEEINNPNLNVNKF